MNQAIALKLGELNNRPFQKLSPTRKALFETLDKLALKPLPEKPYEYAEWKKARVNIDYHIEVDHHYYSVPYQLIKQQVDVRLTQTTVEVLFKNKRVASHARSYHTGRILQKEVLPEGVLRGTIKPGEAQGPSYPGILQAKS